MFCFGAASIADVELPTPTHPNELLRAQEPPAWLHLFLDAEDCLSSCPLNCFSGNMNHQFGAKLPRTHRIRYFCTDCPDEGAIRPGGIIEHHLKHRILKVRKLTGVVGPVIKVRDIEPLSNISSVLPHWSANVAFAYLKLKSFRQSVWGPGSEKILCFECLRLANSYESERYKYCSIKCAFPTAANIPPRYVPSQRFHEIHVLQDQLLQTAETETQSSTLRIRGSCLREMRFCVSFSFDDRLSTSSFEDLAQSLFEIFTFPQLQEMQCSEEYSYQRTHPA